METNKLLTLEEIEKMDAGLEEFITDHPSVNEINVRLSAIKKALATARAYHELAKESIEDERRYVETLWQDKPHLPTLKVIMEAMKNARNKRATYYSEGGAKENALRASDIEEYLEHVIKKSNP